MDILLTHGYFLRDDPAEQRVMKPYPPLGILYLSAYLKEKGFDVEVFDSTFSSIKAFHSAIEQRRPPIVGIYVNLMTKLNALKLITFCKSQGSIVLVGGPEVPYHAEQFLLHGADVAVLGEAEHTLSELVPHLLKSGCKEMTRIAGIAYRDASGGFVQTDARQLVPDLDSLPDPDRGAINVRQYIDTWRTHHGRGSVSLICARGCPFTCTWCSRSVFGETHRRRSVRRVVDEIEFLLNEYTPDQLWFCDDVFTINHKWFYEFYAEMKKRELAIPFECISRADRLNDDILGKMAELGAFRIWYGSESGSQRILDAMERRVTTEKIRSVTKSAQRFGIEAGLFVMLGYPGERVEDIDATIQHLKETNPDTYLTTVAYPIKGTTMYHQLEDTLINDGPWGSSTDRGINFKGRYSRQFYWFATRHMVNEVLHHKLSQNGNASFAAKTISYAKSKIARLGMSLTQHVRS